MIKNYIKIAFRSLLRFKGYTIINLIGLTTGLSVAILIMLFVMDEIGYDQFHEKKDRIYKVVTDNPKGGTMETNAWPVATVLKDQFPEVEKVVYSRNSSLMLNYEGKRYDHEVYFAGKEFFNIFSFKLLEGDPNTALDVPYSIVITEDMRDRYFGSELVLGKTLVFQDSIDFTVTGVVENLPSQSHIQFEMLASFSTHEKLTQWFSYSEGWGNFDVRNYILLKEGANATDLQTKAANIYMENVGDWLSEMGMEFQVGLIPLDQVYLGDKTGKFSTGNGFGPQGSIDQIYLVSGIAIFVLLLACINFINLSTARSVYRAKEVGLRKMVGSSRLTLLFQFISEALLLTSIALVFALITVDIVLPFFNQLMGKEYGMMALFSIDTLLGIVVLLFLVSFLSGYYPAVVLSGYRPIEVLRGSMQTSTRGIRLRRFLVVFQFFITSGLVLATFIVLQQLDFMRNQDLGFDKEQVLVLDATRVSVNSSKKEAFRNALNQIPDVQHVSFTNALPGKPGWLGQWAYPDVEEGEQVDTEYMAVDAHYLETLGLELIAGNNFDPNKNMSEAVIINETTVKEIGWETPANSLGKKIVSPSDHPSGTVIGVVKDFHGLGLQDEIWPQVMDYAADRYGRYFAVKFTTGNTQRLIEQSEVLWKEYLGDHTYEYFFLDENFDRQYRAEDRLMKVFILFAAITLIIAVIGLLGMVSFIVVARTREIGIRKILGAQVLSLSNLLTKEFAILVVVANVLVFPLVWHYGNQWLSSFAYHTSIHPISFIVALITTLFIAMATVSVQTIKAALANPIDSIKSE